MTKENNIHAQKAKGFNEDPFRKGHFLPRMAFLGIISLALANFGFFALFSSVPLALSHLIFGRLKTLSMCAIMTAALVALSMQYVEARFMTGIFFSSSVIAFSVAESIKKFQAPVDVLVRGGVSILTLVLLVVGAYEVFSSTGLVETIETMTESTLKNIQEQKEFKELLKSTSNEAAVLNRYIRKPELMSQEMLHWLFPSTVISVFMWVWLTLVMLLRNSLIWKRVVVYPFGVRELLTFRMPFYWVYPIILGLVLVAGSSFEIIGPTYKVIGNNILFSLGIFYFFQGFGVFSDTLTYFRILGFFRTMLTIMMVFFAFQLVVLIGLFDTWINFRKFLKNKDRE